MKQVGYCQLNIKHQAFELAIEFNISAAGIMGIFGPSGSGEGRAEVIELLVRTSRDTLQTPGS